MTKRRATSSIARGLLCCAAVAGYAPFISVVSAQPESPPSNTEDGATGPTDTARDEWTTARARQLFQQGSQAYTEGRYEAAMTLLSESYRLSGRPALLYNMANTLERLGRTDEAIDHLRRYLEDAPPEQRESITIRISALEARAEAAREEEERAEQERAEREAALLRRSEPQAEEEGGAFPWGPASLLTISALALGTGVTFALLSRNANNSGVDQCLDTQGDLLCRAGAAADLDDAQTLGIVADISLGISLGTAVAGLLWLLIDSGDEPEESNTRALTMGAAFSTSGGTVGLRYRL